MAINGRTALVTGAGRRLRQWRRLERRAVDGYERDLMAALDELCARHPLITSIEVDPAAGRTAKIGLGDRRIALEPVGPTGLALLTWARRDGGTLGLDAAGRYGPFWWLRLSTASRPVTLLGHTLRLSAHGGGASPMPAPPLQLAGGRTT
jgi:hypothetical protein